MCGGPPVGVPHKVVKCQGTQARSYASPCRVAPAPVQPGRSDLARARVAMRRGSFDRVMPSPASGSLFASRAPAAQAAADAQEGDGGWFSCSTETVAGWKRGGAAEDPQSDYALRLRLASALPWTVPRRTSEDAQAMSGDDTCSEDGPASRCARVVGQERAGSAPEP